MNGAPDRPLFVWDGACGFCRFWMLRWKDRVGDAVEVGPYQEVGDRVPEMDEEDFRRSAKLVEEDGTVHEAAAAVFRLLSLTPGPGLAWWLYRQLAAFRWLTEAGYRFVARNRTPLGSITGLLWGRHPPPHHFRTGGWLLLRALAVVYLVGFASLAVQVGGLVGPEGILPVGDYLSGVAADAGSRPAAWLRAPTLAWLVQGTGGLLLLCGAGMAASAALFLGVRPLIGASLAWVLYLSLTVAGQRFLAYQWDLLLVEAGFLALFLAPAGGPPTTEEDAPESPWARRFFRAPRPWFPVLWLVWWLLFRLILESGLVKLASGDPVWRDLTALAHHYETQPLPNPVAWLAHQLPLWFHQLSTLGTLVVELAVPLLFFLPRRPRFMAGFLVVGHQLLIGLTGNYTFFNVLTIALALCLFDDAVWRWILARIPRGRALTEALGTDSSRLPERLRSIGAVSTAEGSAGSSVVEEKTAVPGTARKGLAVALGAVALVLGSYQILGSAGRTVMPGPVNTLRAAVAPFGLVNRYGLFADMTTTRPEIVLEGRRADGPWRTLEFRYKAGDPGERPKQVAPHQPRVDWQMWFSALRADRVPVQAPPRMRYDRWFLRFVQRLLDGEEAVWGLLAADGPFREGDELRPPDRIRAVLYDYSFTTPAERARSGRWWSRERTKLYLPPVRRTERGLEVVGESGG